jgi:hypothetical protein
MKNEYLKDIIEAVFNAVKDFYFQNRPAATVDQFWDELKISVSDEMDFRENHLFYNQENLVRFYNQDSKLIEKLVYDVVYFRLNSGQRNTETAFVDCLEKLKSNQLDEYEIDKNKKILAIFAIRTSAYFYT